MSVGGIVRFKEADLTGVSFEGSDLMRFDFYGCKFEDSGQWLWWREKLLYDDKKLETKKNPSSEEYLKVEKLYTALKQRAKEAHDWGEVSIWHYNEKEMARKRSATKKEVEKVVVYKFWKKFKRLFKGLMVSINNINIYTLYWLVSGYGERPLRAFGVWIILLIVGALVNWISGYEEAVVMTLKQAFPLYRDSTHDENTLQVGVLIFISILLYSQFALFLMALRNRFRR